MKDIDDFLSEYVELLPTEGLAVDKEKAAKFLVGLSHLINLKHTLVDEQIKASSLKDIEYAKALGSAEGSSAPQRQANAEANSTYIEARETYEKAKNQVNTVQGYVELFNNAHILYRQLNKDMEA